MEKEVFPKIDLFPRVSRAARYIRSLVFNTNVPLHMSNHYVREHFVDDPLATPAEVPTSLEAQLPLEGGWDDCGRYMNADGEF